MPSQNQESSPDKIACLFNITEAIHSTLDLRNSLHKVLDLLAQHLGITRSTITLLNPETSEINTEVAFGISAKEKTRGRYKLGEGVTGRVIESGRPMVIPNIDAEPLFLDRTGARSNIDKSNISFVCVPIKDGQRVIGAISIDRLFKGASLLDEDLRVLTIISSLIAQKVALLEKVNRETDQLREENIRLKKELNKKYSFTNIIPVTPWSR
jgi:Nif-specific regulatory protein